MKKFTECMAFNNESTIRQDPDNPERVARTGLPTEAALKVLTEKFRKYDRSFQSKSGGNDLEEYNKHVMRNQKKLETL